jgi:hypothetical protein
MNYTRITSTQPPDILSEYLSNQPAILFDYEKLDTQIRMVVQQRTKEIKNLMRRTIQEIIEIGQKLNEVKAQLGHGHFRNWLKAEFDWSIQTANRFMQVAEKFKCRNLTHLDIAPSALYLLASPSTPEEARTEALQRAINGENITYTKAKTIVWEHKNATYPKDSKDKLTVTTFDRNEEQLDNIKLKPASIGNQTATADTSEIERKIKQLPPEQLAQLALAIIHSGKNRLSQSHLSAIITAAQQALS